MQAERQTGRQKPLEDTRSVENAADRRQEYLQIGP